MGVLNEQEIESRLFTTPDWRVEGKDLIRTVTCDGFQAAIAYVIRVGFLAESADHHPDILVQYLKVTLRLSTHSVGGLTENDFSLAREIDRLKI